MLLLKKIMKPFQRPQEEDILARINRQLMFSRSEPLSLGIECEFGIVDAATCAPKPVALGIVKQANDPAIQHELYQHMIEITSDVAGNVKDAVAKLNDRLSVIMAPLPAHSAALIAAGSLPLFNQSQAVPTETERYKLLRETRQELYRRFTTLGMHIHIGMSDTQSCIRYQNFFLRFLPHLLALSASSPFEEGRDTGFDSIRPAVTESMPTGGPPYQFESWQEYKDLCRSMARSNSISDLKDLWWDIRPCPRYGTLELRICDQPATMAEVGAIAAFVHCLGHWFSEHQQWLDDMPRPAAWRMRENKWRAMRYGLDAEIVADNFGTVRPLREDIAQWVERLAPIYERLGYEQYRDTLEAVLANGNSAQRQKRVYAAEGNFEAVYRHIAMETAAGHPLWEKLAPVMEELPEPTPLNHYQYPHYLPQGYGLWLF
ncbi:MAG TPA: YbdK family carboxylate-amine ligase [Patescibacteria group bacterium]|nr:YbdK family carboxylate-amine ligase [Patescibacteria group bacterium]